MPNTTRARRFALVALVALLGTTVVSCRDANLNYRCNTKELGRDGDLVLICRGGRWRKLMTTREAFFHLAKLKRAEEAAMATTAPPTTAPATAPPTTQPPTTTTTIPTATRPAAATAIGVGYAGACARVDGGFVVCWGANGNGQLGGTPIALVPQSSEPVTANVQNADAVHVGAVHNCATVSTAVRCWGGGGAGQLGNGSTGFSTTPVAVSSLTGVSGLNSGLGNTCAITTSSEVWCWGDNAKGQLGDGSTAASSVPVKVPGISDAVDVAASLGGHTCAVRLTGEVLCWGRNDEGQLGLADGQFTDSPSPLGVASLTTAETVSTGNLFTCSLRSDDSIVCWGDNAKGQLGDGTTTDSDAFVSVSGITDAAQVSVGGSFACALVTVTPSVGGSVSCWGENTDGQLGDGTNTDSSTPVAVSGITTAVAVSAGYKSACALLADGSVRCWGDNTSGQLGDGTTTSSNVPVTVLGIP